MTALTCYIKRKIFHSNNQINTTAKTTQMYPTSLTRVVFIFIYIHLLNCYPVVVIAGNSSSSGATDISAIILPLASSVWTQGKSATVSYRFAGELNNNHPPQYEIDLMTGDPDNAQLVYVFTTPAAPTTNGVNAVTVKVPTSVSNGKYAIRVGKPDAWKYSQTFTIDSSGKGSSDNSPVALDTNDKGKHSSSSSSSNHGGSSSSPDSSESHTGSASNSSKSNTATSSSSSTISVCCFINVVAAMVAVLVLGF